MFLFHKKGIELDGKNPTMLTGYGGFNISLTPSFCGARFVWLEHGGVFAVANLRGGAEFGEDWHRAGMLEKKQNVFDDFIAAAEFLISDKITDKDHLAIQGGSNGGLLMGAALHSASRSVPRRGLPGPAARHAALSELSDRQAVGARVRLRRRPQAVRLALRLLALPPREAGHGVSGHPVHDRRHRHAASTPCTPRRWRR